MRKDIIPGLGDTANLVVIGGRRDTECGMSVWWTTFYLACVDTEAESEAGQSLPSFTIVATVSRPAIATADMRFLNRHLKAHFLSPSDTFLTPRIRTKLTGHPPPSALFQGRCSGLDSSEGWGRSGWCRWTRSRRLRRRNSWRWLLVQDGRSHRFSSHSEPLASVFYIATLYRFVKQHCRFHHNIMPLAS